MLAFYRLCESAMTAPLFDLADNKICSPRLSRKGGAIFGFPTRA